MPVSADLRGLVPLCVAGTPFPIKIRELSVPAVASVLSPPRCLSSPAGSLQAGLDDPRFRAPPLSCSVFDGASDVVQNPLRRIPTLAPNRDRHADIRRVSVDGSPVPVPPPYKVVLELAGKGLNGSRSPGARPERASVPSAALCSSSMLPYAHSLRPAVHMSSCMLRGTSTCQEPFPRLLLSSALEMR